MISDSPEIGDIRREWDWVKVGIEEILAGQPQLTFRPEDVYAECLSGDAVLWVAPEGFCISTKLFDQYTGDYTFFLWLAGAKERGKNASVKYMPFFCKFAKENGFKHIETRTPISALESYFASEGWNKDTVIYTREL